MQDYMLIGPNGDGLLAFRSDGRFVWRHGVPNRASHIELKQGELPLDAIRRQMGQFGDVSLSECVLRETELPQAHYHPRMARPSHQHPLQSPGRCPGCENLESELASLRGQLVTLMRQLERICQTVHPCGKTFAVYGHDIRNLLILASTEAETHWRSVLLANGVQKDRYSTNDYVQLVEPMRLDEYAIALPYYPWLVPLRPFEGWTASGKPTQDLKWYDGYNAVKHDREQNFARSKLIYAMQAVCACAVMLYAQFGPAEALRWRVEFGYFFRLTSVPKWRATQVYIEPEHGSGAEWTAVPYQFP